MRNLHATALRAAIILLLITQGVLALYAQSQQIWPGDINNNGIVNGIDLLYHGIAEGNTGPERLEKGANWVGYTSAPSWLNSFTDGVNFSNADVNGRGKVEQGDRKALWQQNYGNTHGTINPDLYSIGDTAQDPVLLLSADNNSSLEAGDVLNLNLSLGDASHSVDHFFGITFTIKFDPQYFADELTAPSWNPNVASLNLLPNTWLNGTNGNAAEAFIQLNDQAGEIEVVILRKEQGEVSGHGDIASIMIIVEDIAFLEDINTGITVEKIKMVDQNLIEYPVAGATEYVTILASSTQALMTGDNANVPANSQTNREGIDKDTEYAVPASSASEEAVEVTVYPNPVVNSVTIAARGKDNLLQSVQLFSAVGQLLVDHQPNEADETQVDMTNLPKGNYFLQLTTNNGTTVKQVTK